MIPFNAKLIISYLGGHKSIVGYSKSHNCQQDEESLTLVLLTPDIPCVANIVDPDQ